MADKGKRYNKEFNDSVIRMIKEDGRSVASVAKELGTSEQTIYRWLEQHKVKQEPEKLRIMELEAELKVANRRVADLEESVTILKKPRPSSQHSTGSDVPVHRRSWLRTIGEEDVPIA